MTQACVALANDFGELHEIGAKHYRAWVGPPKEYDVMGAQQFNMLTHAGLLEKHTLLDVGCGSLRGGRYSIMYLRPGNYYGIEPTEWVLADGKRSLGDEFLSLKKPNFSSDGNFTLTTFGRTFDFVLVHSVFAHAARNQITRCLEQAKEVMHKDSLMLATFCVGATDHVGDEWVYPKPTRYTKPFITKLVQDSGLYCTHVDYPHPYEQQWFFVTREDRPIDVGRIVRGENFSWETVSRRRAAEA
ncbi:MULTISPECIES: class I SAM-dependent methyltransferase [unclassified Bradyrhizobium]|uniref:class I SAM-dependent methyltransferase n=1 Tax=unclassified Bradyrhizobium TaxID=2631580 RepID=UPI002915C7F2|nr:MULTISPECIES: class I SAM-dependent methyltransferase [unclassified Bradyrhizobium]